MASKRSRATFEADLIAQQSPYVIYGTPLPPLDPDTRDDGSYVPVWKQEVTDEQGRKRLHGAFTGGFSAGYFNTVGSKEGWAPSTFVSSRSSRKKDAAPAPQRPEDFMDEEDLAEAEEARNLQTTEAFAGFGSMLKEGTQHESFMDVLKITGETMGVKLLKKMGWREGQGVGPKIRRKAKLDEGQNGNDEPGQQTHLFAPENSTMISFSEKNDRKGLGFEGEAKLFEPISGSRLVGSGGDEKEEEEDGAVFGALTTGNKVKQTKAERKGAFGVGILNDNGYDDEDPYHMGPQVSYNRIIGGDKKKKKKSGVIRPSPNPLLSKKPIFISKKTGAAKGGSTFRRCHDGRLPLSGFILSSNLDPLSSILSQDGKYAPPTIPKEWKSSKMPADTASGPSQASFRSSAAVAAASKLSPKSRAALLGEMPLPGKSVFDFLTPGARDRIATATNNSNLPPALGEGSVHSSSSHTRTLNSLVPQLDSDTARTALGRGTAGWMPYSEDVAKRARYRIFLEIRAGYRPGNTLPDRESGATNDDWAKEMNEFAHAAQIFKPMTGMMATRFTSSSSAPKLATDNVKLDGLGNSTGEEQLLQKPTEKVKTAAEEAAAVGMYGPLTRSIENFYPTRLLCKRFNIKPPAHVQIDPGEAPPTFDAGEAGIACGMPPTHSTALPQKRLELIGESDMKQLRMSGSGGMRGLDTQMGVKSEAHEDGVLDLGQRIEETLIDPERNEALEKERPGEAVFKAIFGSDSEDD